MTEADPAEPSATPAGIYDWWLGGNAGTRADRDAARRIMTAVPEIRQIAWANRDFLMRSVTWMAERGIRQFIDVGVGFPAQRATHEVARAVRADCRVVYTDNDPAVVERGRQMLAGAEGTAVIHADIRQPAGLFGHPDTARLIDPAEPTGLLVIAVTQFVPDEDDPWSLVASHMAPLAPGSCLAVSAPTADHKSERQVDSVVAEYASAVATVNRPRARGISSGSSAASTWSLPTRARHPASPTSACGAATTRATPPTTPPAGSTRRSPPSGDNGGHGRKAHRP